MSRSSRPTAPIRRRSSPTSIIGGFRTLESLNHGYAAAWRRSASSVVHDYATEVDTTKKMVKTRGGRTLSL